MTKTVADYAIAHNIDDSLLAFTVGGRDHAAYEFHLPSDVDPGQRCILSFMVQTSDADDLRFSAEVNNHEVLNYTINSEVLRAFQEICPINLLRDGIQAYSYNNVTFKLHSGDGTLRIGDVVLWFQRNT